MSLRFEPAGKLLTPAHSAHQRSQRSQSSVRFSVGIACFLCLCWCRVSLGQTAYPMLMSIEPVASQIGNTSEHTIKSRYSMAGAYAIMVSGSGVRGEVVTNPDSSSTDPKAKPDSGESLKIRLQVEPDAMPGIRDLRVATPRGVSTVGQIVLVADPVVFEENDNDTADKAQRVTLPVTVCGRIEKAEDVDFVRFQVDAGSSLCCHVMCMRLQDRIHDLQQHTDPILTIYDANGGVVASSDNELRGDPLICHRFDRDGEYVLEIRDVRFQGNTYWQYSLEINDRPLIVTTFPVALPLPGKESQETRVSLQLVGYGVAEPTHVDHALQTGLSPGIQPQIITLNPSTVRPVTVVASDQPLVSETGDINDTLEGAQSIRVPSGVNGRIDKAGDVDCFAFEAKKGERYSFEVMARRVGSALDSHLRILDSQGKQLQLSDDARIGKRNYSDSLIENWTAPADGRYILEMRDLQLRGGEGFVYYLNATRSEPYFSLFTDTDKTQISPGTTGVLFVRAERKNGFDGEIQLAVENLPAGVKAHCGRILAGKGVDGCILFEAAAESVPAVAEITISGTANLNAADEVSRQYTVQSVVYQEIYQPGGGRGHWPVDSHVLAVNDPGDIRQLRVSSSQLSLKPGESQSIDVEIDRAEGFDQNVTLEVTYSHLNSIYGNSLPEGVTIDAKASTTLLTAGATKGKITFQAAENAPAANQQQFAIMANVSLNFVMKATYASEPMTLSVVPR